MLVPFYACHTWSELIDFSHETSRLLCAISTAAAGATKRICGGTEAERKIGNCGQNPTVGSMSFVHTLVQFH